MEDDQYTWKQYGKLPIHSRWNFARLEEFKAKPVIDIRRLEVLCDEIERQIAPEVLQRWKVVKKSKGDRPRWDGDWFLVTPKVEEALLAEYGEGWRIRFMWRGSEEATWLHINYY